MDRAPSCPVVSLPPVRRTARRTGYTLVELIVALVIVGITAALGIPRISQIANQNRVLRGAQAVQIEVQQAFAIAGRNRAPVTVRWSSASVELQVTNRTGSTIYRRANMRAFGLDAADVSVSPSVFTVFPNGIAGDSLTIRVQRGSYSRMVRVSRAGMIRIQ